MNEQGAIFRKLFELNHELVRMLGIRKHFGGIERDNVVGDDLVSLVCKVGFLSG